MYKFISKISETLSSEYFSETETTNNELSFLTLTFKKELVDGNTVELVLGFDKIINSVLIFPSFRFKQTYEYENYMDLIELVLTLVSFYNSVKTNEQSMLV